jgi:hypothetical protein
MNNKIKILALALILGAGNTVKAAEKIVCHDHNKDEEAWTIELSENSIAQVNGMIGDFKKSQGADGTRLAGYSILSISAGWGSPRLGYYESVDLYLIKGQVGDWHGNGTFSPRKFFNKKDLLLDCNTVQEE